MKLSDFEAINFNNVYGVGLVDNLITINSQQNRAITLGELLNDHEDRSDICIVGAGVSGLTLSATLIENGWKNITILERMPELLALQNGCDVRYVHPNIINWPDNGFDIKESDNQTLPWKASTASDVAYGIEKKWMEIIGNKTSQKSKKRPERIISIHTAVSHIHIEPSNSNQNSFFVEWMRDSSVKKIGFKGSSTEDSESKIYKYIVFCTGYGIEINVKHSYWRNEDYGQIRLNGAKTKYLIIGLGDGGISDVLRFCIKNFRADRFLNEQKNKNGFDDFINEISKIKSKTLNGENCFDLLNTSYNKKGNIGLNWRRISDSFLRDARADTMVFLTDNPSPLGFKGVFEKSSASFMNKFLLFILFKNGMFQYFDNYEAENKVDLIKFYEEFCKKNEIPIENIIYRIGSNRINLVNNLFKIPNKKNFKLQFRKQPFDKCANFVKKSNENRKKYAIKNLLYSIIQITSKR